MDERERQIKISEVVSIIKKSEEEANCCFSKLVDLVCKEFGVQVPPEESINNNSQLIRYIMENADSRYWEKEVEAEYGDTGLI